MFLETYSNEIESLEFQIQFSVVGGLKILRMAMDRHPTLINLRIEMSGSVELEEEVYNRILFLLAVVDKETQLSYDESIAAYLFCLSKEKPFTAYRASWRVLDHGGLWWSVQLANLIQGDAKQNLDKFVASSESVETFSDAWVNTCDRVSDYSVLLSFVFKYLQFVKFGERDTRGFFQPANRCIFDYGHRPVSDKWVTCFFEEPSDRHEWTFADREWA